MAGVFKDDKGIVMEPVFKKSDFVLCDVPVPEGYPQSQTHVGIGLLSSGQYIMTTSPYPNVRYKLPIIYLRATIRKVSGNRVFKHPAEYYENPCIYVGVINNGKTPSSFKLAQTTPLMGPLLPLFGYPSFNSDPDLFIEEDRVYVLNRSIYRQEGNYNYYMRLYLIEGKIQNNCFLPNAVSVLREGQDIVGSQCLTSYKGRYILTDVMTNSYNDGETYNGIRFLSSDTIKGLKDSNEWKIVKTNTGELLPWHMSLFQYDGRLFTIIACVKRRCPKRCWQMLGEFKENMTELEIYEKPLTDFNSYRGAALVREDGLLVLYSTTVHEHVKGSKAVDGRNVILATKPFEEVLAQVRV